MTISVIALRDVATGSIIALVAGQTVGVFLRALDDDFTVKKSAKIVVQIWALYFLYLAMPFMLIWDIWTDPESWPIQMYFARQVRMSLIALVMTYPIVVWRCAKRATAVYILNTPDEQGSKPTLLNLAEDPVRSQVVALA